VAKASIAKWLGWRAIAFLRRVMKIRADRFTVLPGDEELEKIQEQVHLYSDWFDEEEMDMKSANLLATIYLKVSMDEGYRCVFKKLAKEVPHKTIEEAPRKKGCLEYVEDGEAEALLPLVKRRMNSKRQRKAFLKDKGEFVEEYFLMSMVIHTGFEAGYNKAHTLEEIAKIISSDQERADMLVELFKEMVGKSIPETTEL